MYIIYYDILYPCGIKEESIFTIYTIYFNNVVMLSIYSSFTERKTKMVPHDALMPYFIKYFLFKYSIIVNIHNIT